MPITPAGAAACFLGDIVPMAAHLPAPRIMAYDLEPLVTLDAAGGYMPTATNVMSDG